MATQPKRTAVLVVHGIGSQRAENTVRGVVDAVWFDSKNPVGGGGQKKLWTHPEPSGIDLDLAVMTTSAIPKTADNRVADFHELYWAHLMSETKAVAVLLWLYELARKGPRFKPGMNGLWWGAACFLCLMHLSIALLVLQAITMFISIHDSIEKLLITPYLMVFIAALLGIIAALRYRLWRQSPTLIVILVAVCLGPCAAFYAGAAGLTYWLGHSVDVLKVAAWSTNQFLPALIALIATLLLMGKHWGLRAFAWPYLLSFVFLALSSWLVWSRGGVLPSLSEFKLPWAINSQSSAIAAFVILGVYLILNAAFLQPYLGDAARYLRNSPANVAVRRTIRKQAVDTIGRLHTCGDYDRIVVIAHSLGSVVAYDMLRAYYSQINQDLPEPKLLGPAFDAVDQGTLAKAAAREQGREVVRQIAGVVAASNAAAGGGKLKSWLVTDFVTLGSPLTHAYFLMCSDNGATLEKDFERRTREREFPTCPPRLLDSDRRLTFDNPNDGSRSYYHHAGLFALTRWTNLYFPLVKLFWGDAIGGPLAPIFGDPKTGAQNISDVAVHTRGTHDDFFSHTLYWDADLEKKYDGPHIVALIRAIDLDDSGSVNGM